MRITVLTVADCPNAQPALERVTAALDGRDARVELVEVTNETEAAQRGMHGSPTILINGTDVRAARRGAEPVVPPVPGRRRHCVRRAGRDRAASGPGRCDRARTGGRRVAVPPNLVNIRPHARAQLLLKAADKRCRVTRRPAPSPEARGEGLSLMRPR
ncbi:hypothetical protein ABT115_29795 [Streptomyces sp. NPDC001832]|uniref:hypothetical protein n=1 Tax=Streptomyces sp. NPDC001832 TaxID=3154527 RepID=UPI003316AB2F